MPGLELEDVADGVYDALAANGALQAAPLGGRVYRDRGRSATYPQVVLGAFRQLPTTTLEGTVVLQRVRFQAVIRDRGPSYTRCRQVGEQVHAVLNGLTVASVGGTQVLKVRPDGGDSSDTELADGVEYPAVVTQWLTEAWPA